MCLFLFKFVLHHLIENIDYLEHKISAYEYNLIVFLLLFFLVETIFSLGKGKNTICFFFSVLIVHNTFSVVHDSY